MERDSADPNRFRTVKSLALEYPDLGTEPAHRDRIAKAGKNGLATSGAIVRIGRKILIDVPKYIDWILSLQKPPAATPPPPKRLPGRPRAGQQGARP